MIKFKSLKINNFGGLSDYRLDLSENAGIYAAPNEFGKSTLTNFILAVLYGLPQNNKKDPRKSKRTLYNPHRKNREDIMGGSLVLSKDQREYEIYASFGDIPKRDQLKIIDLLSSQDITDVLRRNNRVITPGEYFLEIDREAFERSAFVAQTKTALADCKDNKTVFESLLNLQNTGDESISITKIEDFLKKRLSNLKGRSKGAQINNLEQMIGEREEQLRALEQAEVEECQRQCELHKFEQEIDRELQRVVELENRKLQLRYLQLLTEEAKKERLIVDLERQERELLAKQRQADSEAWSRQLASIEEQLVQLSSMHTRSKLLKEELTSANQLLESAEQELSLLSTSDHLDATSSLDCQLSEDKKRLANLLADLRLRQEQNQQNRQQTKQLDQHSQKLKNERDELLEQLSRVARRSQFQLMMLFLTGLLTGASLASGYYLDARGYWLALVLGIILTIGLAVFISGKQKIRQLRTGEVQLRKQLESCRLQREQIEVIDLSQEFRYCDELREKIELQQNKIHQRQLEEQNRLAAAESKVQSRREHCQKLIEASDRLNRELLQLEVELRATHSLPEGDLERGLRERQIFVRQKVDDLVAANRSLEQSRKNLNLAELRVELAELKSQVADCLARLPISLQDVDAPVDIKTEEQAIDQALIASHSWLRERQLQFAELKGEMNKRSLIDSPASAREELAQLRQQLSSAERQYEATLLAKKLMSQAFLEMRRNFAPDLQSKSCAYFEFLSDGKYDNFLSDQDLKLQVGKNDLVEAEYLSVGAFEQAYLSLRLALADLLSAKQALPIIIDDGFTQYDDVRLVKAFQLLSKISVRDQHQIIYFTATAHTVAAAERAGFEVKNL